MSDSEVDTTDDTKQSTDWSFVCFGYGDIEFPRLLAPYVSYCIWGEEIAPTTGNPHLQGAIIFKTKRTGKGAKKLFQDTWWERASFRRKHRKSTLAQLFDYSKKDGLWYEWGTRPHNAETETSSGNALWHRALHFAKDGDWASLERDLPEVLIRHWTTLHAIRSEVLLSGPPPTTLDDPCGLWISGLSGSGKTTTAHSFGDVFVTTASQTRWEGFSNQPVLLLDDLGPSDMTDKFCSLLKTWSDRWAFPVYTIYKGSKPIRPKLVIVTSQWDMEEVVLDPRHLAALKRRFTKLFCQWTPTWGYTKRWSARLLREGTDEHAPLPTWTTTTWDRTSWNAKSAESTLQPTKQSPSSEEATSTNSAKSATRTPSPALSYESAEDAIYLNQLANWSPGLDGGALTASPSSISHADIFLDEEEVLC